MRCGRFGAFEFSRAVKFVMTGGGISFVSVSRAKLSASAPVDVSFVWTSDGCLFLKGDLVSVESPLRLRYVSMLVYIWPNYVVLIWLDPKHSFLSLFVLLSPKACLQSRMALNSAVSLILGFRYVHKRELLFQYRS